MTGEAEPSASLVVVLQSQDCYAHVANRVRFAAGILPVVPKKIRFSRLAPAALVL